MLKFCLTLILMFIIISCKDNLTTVYDNEHDYRSANYVPDAPQNFRIIEYNDTTVSFMWDDVSNGEDGFIIEMKLYDPKVSSIYERIGVVEKDVNIFEYQHNFIKDKFYFFKVWSYSKNNISLKYAYGHLKI